MPELPEVETVRRGIEPLICGKTVTGVTVRNASLRWPVANDLEQRLCGGKVVSLNRRSKYLLIDFTKGTLIIHLGMSGYLRSLQQGEERLKHDHVELCFDDGTVLVYNDARRFGFILWTTDDPLRHERLVNLGPEPLSDVFSAAHLHRLAQRRKSVAIKPFLMDSKVVVGVGNIYASEALFMAGVDPRRKACCITLDECQQIVAAVQAVLKDAIAAGGTTICDFKNSSGKPGYFQQQLHVYGRDGEPCSRCGKPIVIARLGQRSSYFCGNCQR
ncbi:MAG: bifunctional DNA-formamidopyrimidine glycosylase/DNA-(apurinic or apyrimidinic site) lyase [Desulfuromonadales bacterium]|nr:bifunctional DNA-formamidopyrimidine glycosylase/DNA-(apurinic or apyrimidinic site) lyase [Desulfuromonadales bacterium]